MVVVVVGNAALLRVYLRRGTRSQSVDADDVDVILSAAVEFL